MIPIVHYPNIHVDFEDWQIEILRLSLGEIDAPIPFHVHGKNNFEFHYIKEGKGTLFLEDNHFHLSENDFFSTGPEILHAQLPQTNQTFVEYCLNFSVQKKKQQSKDVLLGDLFTLKEARSTNQEHLITLLKRIFQELERPSWGSLYLQQALIQELVIESIRSVKLHERRSSKKNLARPLTTNDQRALLIDQYFLGNYNQLHLEDLSNQLSLSTRQTQRLLVKFYQQTFFEKLLESRMNAANLLLLRSNYRITAIAEQVGYSSIEHFSHAYKKFWGQTPTNYRKNHKKNDDSPVIESSL